MDPDLRELLTETVTVSPASASAVSVYGVPSWSTAAASTYQARYVAKAEQVRDGQGRVVEQRGIVWVDSTSTISTGRRVLLPSGVTAPILAVERYPDEAGLHHQLLRVGW